jgi:hypothetical protein
MGDLSHFNLNNYVLRYGLKYMIETGTYKGDAVAYGLNFGFEKIYSIELLKEFYDNCYKRFENNEKVYIYNGTSENGLIEILQNNVVTECLFWLDAHLPNSYTSGYGSDYVKDKNILIPLENELKIIVENKNVSNDVFIIDDLRIYETGNFQKGSWSVVIDAGIGGIDFIYQLLGNTHDIQRLYDDEGYIICTPKTNI